MNSAILLSAGRGERLRPLTDTLPKALVPVHGKPLIYYHLEKLSRIGINNIVINISHLASKIEDSLGNGKIFGVNITYSREPEALGTGGGIFQALPLLGENPFLVISSDIFTDYDFNLLKTKLDRKENKNILAHLVLAPNPAFHPQGDFSISPEGFLSDIPQYTYASMGVFRPELFRECSAGKFSYVPLLKKAMKTHQVTGELYEGRWYNVGTIEELNLI